MDKIVIIKVDNNVIGELQNMDTKIIPESGEELTYNGQLLKVLKRSYEYSNSIATLMLNCEYLDKNRLSMKSNFKWSIYRPIVSTLFFLIISLLFLAIKLPQLTIKGFSWVIIILIVIAIIITIVSFIDNFMVYNFVSLGRLSLNISLSLILFIFLFADIDYFLYLSPIYEQKLFIPGFNSYKVFNGLEFLYFSILTFTTTGYGDIIPINYLGKLMASSEMIFGWLSSTMSMALIISKFQNFKTPEISKKWNKILNKDILK